MEFRLNKIDPDLRQQVNDSTKEGKIHRKNGLLINVEKDREKREKEQHKKKDSEKFSLSKYAGKKVVTVEALKEDDVQIKGEKQTGNATELKGQFIDIRR